MKKFIKNSSVRKIFSEEVAEDLTEVMPEDFADAEQTLSKEDMVNALATLAGIADAVLEAEGREADNLDYSEVLDIVDEVTEPVLDDETDESAAIDEAIESAVVNLVIADDGNPEELEIITGDGDSMDTVIGADNPDDLIVPAPVEVDADAEIALASSRKVDLTQAKTYKVAINSHWKDIDAVHKKAWDMAEEKTKAAGKTPDMGSKYYGMVMALAKTYYNRLTKNDVWEDAEELGSAKIRAVLSALKKIYSAVAANEAQKKGKYWPGFNDNGEVYFYDHDEYVETFGSEPDEKDAVEASKKRIAAAKYLKSHPGVKIASSAEFDGDTSTKVADSEGTNGDASKITDEGLLADGNQLSGDVEGSSKKKQDTDPLTSIDFDNPSYEEITLPDESGANVAMSFQKVTNSISVLAEKERSRIVSHLYGKVRPLANGKGIVFLKSNIFGLVAVRGDFLKGIKNSRYTAFVKTPAGYADATGALYSAKGHVGTFLIASTVSNHSTKTTTPYDLVASLEKRFVQNLSNSQRRAAHSSKEVEYYKIVSQRRAAFARKVLAQNLSLDKSVKALKQNTVKIQNSVDETKRQMAEQKFMEELKLRDDAIHSSVSAENSKNNVDFLSSLM